MRTRLLRAVAAGILVVTIGLAGTAQAAPAASRQKAAEASAAALVGFDWVGAVITVATALLSGGGGSAEVDAALRQILASIEASKTEIIRHVDLIAAAEIQSCFRSATIEFTDIDTMGTSVRQLWAQSVTRCATDATSYLRAIVAAEAVDNIGKIVGPLFAIVVAARTKAGFTNGLDLVLADEISSYESVKTKLTPPETTTFAVPPPRCVTWWQYPDPSGFIADLYYTCTTYNGDSAQGVQQYWYPSMTPATPPIDKAAIQAEATRNTSRQTAIDALARLRNLRPVM
jgi:hypothetical protein